MNKLPKVLVSCPTASAKNYTAKEWMLNVNLFTYPNFDCVVYDNTVDNGVNANYLNNLALDNFCLNFKAIHSQTDNVESVIERMCISHNLCRDACLDGNYDYLLHLESDVIPCRNVIEKLIENNRDVVGALYYRDSGISRRLMAQRRIYKSSRSIVSENFLPQDDVCFVDGNLKEVSSIGLGCVLIKRNVLEKIKFRFVENENNHPDSYFSEDCFRNKIKIYADTNLICSHNNENWGIYGLNWK